MEFAAAATGSKAAGAAPSASNAPEFLATLQERLGLRLELGKGPVPFLVIDKLERPTAN